MRSVDRTFEPSFRTALPWLYGIAANLVRRHRRTEVRRLRAYARTGVDESVELDGTSVVEQMNRIRRRLSAHLPQDLQPPKQEM